MKTMYKHRLAATARLALLLAAATVLNGWHGAALGAPAAMSLGDDIARLGPAIRIAAGKSTLRKLNLPVS